jgi:hypothetical protein
MTVTNPPLNAGQTAVVHHGEPAASAPRFTLEDLHVVYSERDDLNLRVYPAQDEPASIVGHCEVFVHRPSGKVCWYRSTHSMSTQGCTDSREAAEAGLLASAEQDARYWDEKVAWAQAGDLRPANRRGGPSEPVIRADGVHYVLGPEPRRDSNGALIHDGMLGFGGREFRFRMLADDRVVVSHNVWHQGRIPVEYADQLPDNAEALPYERRPR